MVVMVERVKPMTIPPVQAVAPQPNQAPAPAPQPGPALRPVPALQPGPAPRPGPAPVGDGSSQEEALEILDSEDELISDMTLTPRREQRLRRQLQAWRSRQSSSSD